MLLKSTCQFALIAAVAVFAASAGADDAAKTCPASKCAAGTCEAGKCASCQECPVEAAMKKLPQLTFVVGDQKTCCPDSAGKIAEQSGKPIHFVVAGKTFTEESDANLALVEETETFVHAYAEPKVCKVSGTTTVAGTSHSCSVAAGQTASLVKAAMDKVRMTYLVGDKACHCPIEAKEVAEKTGKPTLLVVADEKTCCNVTARLNLARAKYKAAVLALAKANTQERESTDES